MTHLNAFGVTGSTSSVQTSSCDVNGALGVAIRNAFCTAQ